MSVLVFPILRGSPGNVLQWYSPDFHSHRAAELLRDILAEGAYHFFWEQVLFI